MIMKELLTEIRRKIRTRDNGPAVDVLRQMGLNYKIIHGLSIAEIKGIACNYQYNNDLAEELWKWDHREFKILATFISDPKTIAFDTILQWGKELDNSELAEQLSINLAFNTSFADQLISEWLACSDVYTQKAGVVLLAWRAQRNPNLSDSYFSQQLEQLPSMVQDNFPLAKGISFAIRAIGKRNRDLNTKAIACIKSIEKIGTYGAQVIVEEALWELESDIVQERL
jgi:3-methyladenine DNA glycosylase AlkD